MGVESLELSLPMTGEMADTQRMPIDGHYGDARLMPDGHAGGRVDGMIEARPAVHGLHVHAPSSSTALYRPVRPLLPSTLNLGH